MKFILMAIILMSTLLFPAFAQEIIKYSGIVEEIAEDSSFVVVSGRKIPTTKEQIEDSLIFVDDKVELEIVLDGNGDDDYIAKYDFIFADDSDAVIDDSYQEDNEDILSDSN